MAQLTDVSGTLTVTLQCVPPSPAGPHDAYRLRIDQDGRTLLDRTASETARQMPHHPMRGIARAFLHAPRLIGRGLGFSLGDSGAPEFEQGAAVRAGCGWLEVVLEEGGGGPDHPRVRASLAVRSSDRLAGGRLERRLMPPLFECDPEAARQFGADLLREMMDTMRARRDAGMPAPDDFDEPDGEVEA